MRKLVDIITPLHKKTKRDYFARMADNKVQCMKVARMYDREFWDGNRRYGYGGYTYDGRWDAAARKIINLYNLPQDANILDVGSGKGFLLYEIKKVLPASKGIGIDISGYAMQEAKSEIREGLFQHKAQDPYPFRDDQFDLVISLNTLHNLHVYELKAAIREIERVGRDKYIVVESYKNEEELFNLQCWALTCESFFTPLEWIWLFNEFGYTGDYEFINFE